MNRIKVVFKTANIKTNMHSCYMSVIPRIGDFITFPEHIKVLSKAKVKNVDFVLADLKSEDENLTDDHVIITIEFV